MTTIIKLEKNELSKRLKLVGKIASEKIDQADMLRLVTEGERVVMWATDLSGNMMVAVDAIEIAGEADCCIQALPFEQAIAEIKDQPVTIYLTEKKARVVYFGGEFSLPVFPSKDFFMLKKDEEATSITMDCEDLSAGLRQTVRLASKDELRPIVCGVCLEARDKVLSFVGTDGTVLALREFATESENMQVVLPVKAVKLLLFMLPMMPKLLEVKVSKWRVYVEGENSLFIYQLLEGRFPNYRSVIPTNIHEVEVPVADLLEALRRVAVLGNQKQMTMTVTHDAIFLTSENEEQSSSSKEELSVKSIFKLKIGLNINYFIALLSVIESKDCVLSFTDEAHAMLVKPVDENERLTLLQMPVKL